MIEHCIIEAGLDPTRKLGGGPAASAAGDAALSGAEADALARALSRARPPSTPS